jgi:hypothetical protein
MCSSGAFLEIYRDGRPRADRRISYTVVLDGQKCGKLTAGEGLRIEIGPGPHTLRLASQPWGHWRSPDIEFEVSRGQVTRYQCRPLPEFGLGVYYLALDPGHWIRLEPVGARLTPADEATVTYLQLSILAVTAAGGASAIYSLLELLAGHYRVGLLAVLAAVALFGIARALGSKMHEALG